MSGGASATGPSGRRRPNPAERRRRHAEVDDLSTVLDAAARLLEGRPRSVAETRRRLTAAGYRTDLVEGAIGRLANLGYLDDEAFTRAWVESRDRARPRGEAALRRELRLKGVDPAIVDAVLEERDVRHAVGGTDVEADAADRLLERHARALGRIADPRRRRERAWALLARSGFDPSTASDALRRMERDATGG